MPCIWGQHSNSQLFCIVTVIPPDAPDIANPHEPLLPTAVTALTALIDTGATTTCISKRAVDILKLQPIGKAPVHGVSGVTAQNVYLFYIAFPFHVPPRYPVPPGVAPSVPGKPATQLHLLQKVLQGCEFDGGPTPTFDVLLGMDVISTGSLVVQGNGTFSFSF